MHNLKSHEIPGRVTIFSGKGGLPAIRIETDASTAEIYQHGAHVTGFQHRGQPPLLFMSAASEFHPEKPIRGGVPVIFPWFGARDNQPMHGYARLADWDLLASAVLPDGSVSLHFSLPARDDCQADYTVTIGGNLTMELAITNTGAGNLTFENCLHTYFQVGDIRQVRVAGLQGARYRDQLLAAEFTETADAIRFTAETDRVYQGTEAAVEIIDPALGRTIHVRKSDSMSTVVWNPWIEKSRRMPDFGDDEFPHMVCVESGNVREHATTLARGQSSSLKVTLDSTPLA